MSWSPEKYFASLHERAIEIERLRMRNKDVDQREVLIAQIQRESLRLTLKAFPEITRRIDGEAAVRRIAVAWAEALAEAGA